MFLSRTTDCDAEECRDTGDLHSQTEERQAIKSTGSKSISYRGNGDSDHMKSSLKSVSDHGASIRQRNKISKIRES